MIDNAEHLLPDVADAVAQLAAIAGPCLCVTSRERLALPGEHVFTVPALSDRDSVALFVARARQLDPAFSEAPALAALCRQLDNLPLAIELAAARSTLFSVDELAERLGQSIELLKAGRGERGAPRDAAGGNRLVLSLAAGRGAARLSSVRDVPRRLHRGRTGADRGNGSGYDRIAARQESAHPREGDAGPRLFMLELVRRHAAELLAGDPGTGALAATGALFFTDVTEEAFASIASFAADSVRWWCVMRDERDNVRAALAFHHAAGDAVSLARTCTAEWFLWFFIGDPVEGAEWLRRALELGPPRHLLSAWRTPTRPC